MSLLTMRDSMKHWLKWGIIAFLVIFTISIFFGYMSYDLKSGGSSLPKNMVEVNGVELSRESWMQAVAAKEEQYDQKMRYSGGAPMLNKVPDIWLQTLDEFAEGVALDQAIKERKLKVSKDELEAELTKQVEDTIQARWPEPTKLRQYLVRKGMDEKKLRKELRAAISPEMLKQQMLMEKLRAEVTAESSPTEADLKASYDTATVLYIRIPGEGQPNAPEGVTPEAVQKKVDAVQAGLAAKKPFEALAKEYSADPPSPVPFKRGQTIPEFDKAVFAAKPGEVGGPLDTKFGKFFYKLISIKSEIPKDFETNKAQLLSQYAEEQKTKAWDLFSAEVKDKAEVKIEDPLLAGFRAISKQDMTNAKLHFEKAAEVYAQWPTYEAVATGWLGRIAELAFDWQTAVKYYQQAVEAGGDATLYIQLGLALLETGDKKGAKDAFVTASELGTTEPNLHMQLAGIYRDKLKDEAAAKQEDKLAEKAFDELFGTPETATPAPAPAGKPAPQ